MTRILPGRRGLSAMLLLTSLGVAALEPLAPPADRVPAVWLGPAVLEPTEAGIGRRIPDVELVGLDGQGHRLHDALGPRGAVVVVRDPECPVSQRYARRVAQLARSYRREGFRFVFIYPSETLSRTQRSGDADSLAVPGLFVERGSFALAEQLGVKSTGDVFVLDSERRLVYRGAVDDQYGLGYTKELPTRRYLRNALDDLVNGRAVAVPATSAPGCYIDADPSKDDAFPLLPDGHLMS